MARFEQKCLFHSVLYIFSINEWLQYQDPNLLWNMKEGQACWFSMLSSSLFFVNRQIHRLFSFEAVFGERWHLKDTDGVVFTKVISPKYGISGSKSAAISKVLLSVEIVQFVEQTVDLCGIHCYETCRLRYDDKFRSLMAFIIREKCFLLCTA